MEQGIDSISLNPDTVVKTTLVILDEEARLAGRVAELSLARGSNGAMNLTNGRTETVPPGTTLLGGRAAGGITDHAARRTRGWRRPDPAGCVWSRWWTHPPGTGLQHPAGGGGNGGVHAFA